MRADPLPPDLRPSASQPCGHFGSFTALPLPPRLSPRPRRCAGEAITAAAAAGSGNDERLHGCAPFSPHL